MEIVKDEPSAVVAPEFDPRKKYTWSSDTTFTLSGNQFGLILNTMRAIISTREAQTILMAAEASDILDGIMAESVANGVVVEIEE
jgi:hypothetical protein